jgi:hypothetical protein
VTSTATARPGVLVVTFAGPKAKSPGPAEGYVRRSELVARFPSGFAVRQVGPRGQAAEARRQRRETARQLLADTRVRLTPRAWSRLAHGDVDPRLLGLLDRVANSHTIDVAAFPRDPVQRAAGAPARAMRVTAVDGVLVGDPDANVIDLRAVLLSQSGDDRPDAVTPRLSTEPPVLLVRVLLPSTTS